MTRTFALSYCDLTVARLVDVRCDLCRELKALGLSDKHIHDLVLVLGEITTNTIRHGGDTSLTVSAKFSSPDRLHLSIHSESFLDNKDDINERIAAIEAGEKIDFTVTGGGLGLRFLCALSEIPPKIDDKGNLVAVFNLSHLDGSRLSMCMVV